MINPWVRVGWWLFGSVWFWAHLRFPFVFGSGLCLTRLSAQPQIQRRHFRM